MEFAHGITVDGLETPDLGDRSYLVSDGDVAAVIDPQRDIDRVLGEARVLGVRITHVLETHIHNDYVSGGLELARETGATYVVAEAEDVAFERHPAVPGEQIEVGRFQLEVVPTPGHTPHHVSFVLRVGDEPLAVFTGGSLLFGAVGRTDLISADLAEELGRAQYRTAHRLAELLPDHAEVYPTHGFGSFCSSDRDETSSRASMGDERKRNPVLTVDDEDSFVAQLLAGYDEYPSYYRHMGPTNRSGAGPIDLSVPPTLTEVVLVDRLEAGAWMVDLRERNRFARSHRSQAVNIEGGELFATYLGWVLPWESELVFLGLTDEQIAEARRAAARVGYDRVVGRLVGEEASVDGEGRAYPVVDFARLAEVFERHDGVVLDVRRDEEWRDGHLPGAVHIHLPHLLDRLDEVPEGEVWVHCGSGFRASIAASLLDAAGRSVVLVDDDWDNAVERGLEVVSPAPAPA